MTLLFTIDEIISEEYFGCFLRIASSCLFVGNTREAVSFAFEDKISLSIFESSANECFAFCSAIAIGSLKIFWQIDSPYFAVE